MCVRLSVSVSVCERACTNIKRAWSGHSSNLLCSVKWEEWWGRRARSDGVELGALCTVTKKKKKSHVQTNFVCDVLRWVRTESIAYGRTNPVVYFLGNFHIEDNKIEICLCQQNCNLFYYVFFPFFLRRLLLFLVPVGTIETLVTDMGR